MQVISTDLIISTYSYCSFIERELGPMHETIGQDVDVNFVAYGGAHTTEVEDGYTFTCQVRSHCEVSCNERGNFIFSTERMSAMVTWFRPALKHMSLTMTPLSGKNRSNA